MICEYYYYYVIIAQSGLQHSCCCYDDQPYTMWTTCLNLISFPASRRSDKQHHHHQHRPSVVDVSVVTVAVACHLYMYFSCVFTLLIMCMCMICMCLCCKIEIGKIIFHCLFILVLHFFFLSCVCVRISQLGQFDDFAIMTFSPLHVPSLSHSITIIQNPNRKIHFGTLMAATVHYKQPVYTNRTATMNNKSKFADIR